jgi:hypothetical protein
LQLDVAFVGTSVSFRANQTGRSLPRPQIVGANIMRFFSLAAASVLATIACSSTEPPAQSTGVARGNYDPRIENRDVNPYNAAYPTADLGTAQATWSGKVRKTPGQRIRNFKFLGHLNADTAALSTVALADYFDPEQRNPEGPIKLIHLQAAGIWCGVCKQEAAALRPLQPTLRDQGIVWLTTVCDGAAPGVDATMSDLPKWISQTKSQNTTVLDPGSYNLGIFFSAAGIPWNAWIDARTMEIVDHQVGAPQDLKRYIADALAKFEANEPRQ